MGFLTKDAIDKLGFASVGKNVQISDKASFYGNSRISIGSNVRIDDFCILSAGTDGIKLGNYIHIAAYCSLIGKATIKLDDFSGLSSRVSIYSSSDDYSGEYMTNPTVPSEFTNVIHGAVYIGRHVIVGSGTIILPNVTLEDGVAVGALSLVTKNCLRLGTYVGNPAKKIKVRKDNLFDLENKLLKSIMNE